MTTAIATERIIRFLVSLGSSSWWRHGVLVMRRPIIRVASKAVSVHTIVRFLIVSILRMIRSTGTRMPSSKRIIVPGAVTGIVSGMRSSIGTITASSRRRIVSSGSCCVTTSFVVVVVVVHWHWRVHLTTRMIVKVVSGNTATAAVIHITCGPGGTGSSLSRIGRRKAS